MTSTLNLSHFAWLTQKRSRGAGSLGIGSTPCIDGYVIGTPLMTRPAPHNGEMHPDGDEVLFLISGRLKVVLEEADGEKVVEMTPGQTLIVPKGVWHRVLPQQASQLLHITPGPRDEWRPLRNSDLTHE